jgi:hypothetical protein
MSSYGIGSRDWLRLARLVKSIWFEGVLGIGGAVTYVVTRESSALGYLAVNGCWSLLMELFLDAVDEGEEIDDESDDDSGDDSDGDSGGPAFQAG